MVRFKDLSFKFKTILGVAFIESILLAIIYFTSIDSLHETNENQIKSRANETSSLIALWVRNGLLTYDVGNTEHFIDSLVESDGLVYVHVKNDDGKTFAFAGNRDFIAKEIQVDSTLKQAEKDGVFDAFKMVTVDDIPIGRVELGLSVNKLSEFIDDVAYRIKMIAVVEVFLSALFSFFLGWLLTRRLDVLKAVALEVKNTGKLVTTGDLANDEIGTVSQAFDEMSTTLIQSQLQLKSNSMRLSEIFNNTRDGMIVFATDGTILTVNPAFMGLVKCYREVEGRTYTTFLEIMRKEIDEADFESMRWLNRISSLESIGELAELHSTIRFRKPNKRLLNVQHKVINDPETQVHSIFFFMDLTKTEEVDRLKSEFVAHAAHELRTPLTSVQGFSELLKKPDISDSMRIELAGIINSQAQRVVTMVSELLDIAKIEAEGVQNFELQQVMLLDIVERVVNEFAIPEGRNPVSTFYATDLEPVTVDVERIYQAILNLLSNAYKYSAIGEVKITLESFDKELEGVLGKGTLLRIVDAGIGMAPEQLTHVFERFWRADQSGVLPGTGLGMSIVKEIIDLHSGTIEVNSQLGQGTEVVLRFYR